MPELLLAVSVRVERMFGVADETRDFWDAQVAAFDEEPDHGLLDPQCVQHGRTCSCH